MEEEEAMPKLTGLFSFVTVLFLFACPAFAQWSIQTVDSIGNVGWGTSVAIASDGTPRISYYDRTNHVIKYAAWTGATWDIQTVASAGGWGSPGAERTSLVLDAADRPRIAYEDDTNNNWDLTYAAWNGTSWDIEAIDHTGGYEGAYCSLKLDPLGRPRISYDSMSTGIHNLKYAAWDGASWDVQTVDGTNGTGPDSCLDLDSNGWPHISYRNGLTEVLKYARWDGASWQIETVDALGNVGTSSSLVLTDADMPLISYRDQNNKDLKFAAWRGTSWDITTVASAGDVGQYSAIALDLAGDPGIAYYNASYNHMSLEYASWNGASWDLTTVDGTGPVAGWYASIAMDEQGLPWIAYYEYANGDLRLAHLVPEPSVFALFGLGAFSIARRPGLTRCRQV